MSPYITSGTGASSVNTVHISAESFKPFGPFTIFYKKRWALWKKW